MKKLSFIVIVFILLSGCEERTTSVIDSTGRLTVNYAFAINENNAVTIGWIAPGIEFEKTTDHDHGEESTPSPFIAGWQVHKSNKDGFNPTHQTLVAELPLYVDRYRDSLVENGEEYFYRVVPLQFIPGGVVQMGEASQLIKARPYDYSAVTTIRYSEHIQPIFNSTCAYSGCHSGTEISEDGDTRIGLKSWDKLMTGDSHGGALVPYKSSKSDLFFHINNDTLLGPSAIPHMPYDNFNLPHEQILLIKRWIDEGAKNDNGDVTLSNYPEGKILITNQADDLVTVVDKMTNLVSRYVQAGVSNVFTTAPHAPHNIVVDKANGYYYVNLVSAGDIMKFRLSDNVKVAELGGFLSPTQVALTVTGDTAFSAQFANNNNAIRMFNTRTMSMYPLQISSQYMNKPHGVQISPDHSTLWVTGNLSDDMMVVDITNPLLPVTIMPLIPNDTVILGTGGRLLPYQTTITSDSRFVYVSCQLSNEVRVIDRDSMKVVKVIPVGHYPLILKLTPDDRFVYVANRNSNDVSVIRTSDNTVIATIADVGPGPHGIDITADGKFAYVSCENVNDPIPPHHPSVGSKTPGFVTVLDLTTNSVVKSFEVGAFAAGVAIVE